MTVKSSDSDSEFQFYPDFSSSVGKTHKYGNIWKKQVYLLRKLSQLCVCVCVFEPQTHGPSDFAMTSGKPTSELPRTQGDVAI